MPTHAVFTLVVLGSLLAGPPARAQTAQDRLWDAAIAGDTLDIRSALADGAVVDSIDTRSNQNGRRALNWAAWYDHVPAIELLLAEGAPIEAENHTGFTALHHAAEAGSLAAARALLAAGADPDHVNRVGRTPVETARRKGHDDVVALLEGKEPDAAKP